MDADTEEILCEVNATLEDANRKIQQSSTKKSKRHHHAVETGLPYERILMCFGKGSMGRDRRATSGQILRTKKAY